MAGQSMVYVPMGQRHQGFHKPTVTLGYLTPKKCLVMLAGVLVFSTVILQILLSFRHAFSDMHLRTDIDGELVIIPKSISHKYGAVCLDAASPPGYYIKRGIDNGEGRWLLVIPHSDWCRDTEECHKRSKEPLAGTTNKAPVTLQFTGILSSDPSENQYFSDWNMISLIPCDGASLLGNQTVGVHTSGSGSSEELLSRGAAVLSATIEHLLTSTDINNADEIVLYGDRAGAVSALAYSAYLSSRFSQVSKFTTILHSGLLLETEKSEYNLPGWFNFHNVAGNTLIANCKDISCIDADNLLGRDGGYTVIILSSDTPAWPLNIQSGCDRNCDISQYQETGQRFQAAEDYSRALKQVISSDKRKVKLTSIVTACDYPVKTTYSLDDPVIDGKSIYSLLVRSLIQPTHRNVYKEEKVMHCPVDGRADGSDNNT